MQLEFTSDSDMSLECGDKPKVTNAMIFDRLGMSPRLDEESELGLELYKYEIGQVKPMMFASKVSDTSIDSYTPRRQGRNKSGTGRVSGVSQHAGYEPEG